MLLSGTVGGGDKKFSETQKDEKYKELEKEDIMVKKIDQTKVGCLPFKNGFAVKQSASGH